MNRRRVGCTSCRLIEPEPGTWVDGLCPQCRAAKRLKTSRIGRPRTRRTFARICAFCGKAFKRLARDEDSVGSFCSSICGLNFTRERRRKLPSGEELRKLYLKENMSTVEIARMFDTEPKSVNSALKKAGVKMRRRTRTLQCQEPGCHSRVKKIRHPTNGALYGTLCAVHRAQHRRELGREYTRRIRSIPPERQILNRDGSRKPMPQEQRQKIRQALLKSWETKRRRPQSANEQLAQPVESTEGSAANKTSTEEKPQ